MAKQQLEPKQLGLQIVAVDHGFVFVGLVAIISDETGQWVEMHNAHNVRRYGTNKGLSQLAAEGPQRESALDAISGLLKFPLSRLLFLMECRRDAWRKLYPA